MGKAQIISNNDNGLYQARLLFDEDSLNDRRSKCVSQKNYYENKLASETDEKKIKYYIILIRSLEATIDKIDFILDSLSDEEAEVWCADYTDDIAIGAVVATLETPGELDATAGAGINIAPGGTAFDKATYGQLKHPYGMSRWAVFYDLCILPAWQKFKPLWRYGIITDIDYNADTCDITLDEATSSAQNIEINKVETLSDVPISYMSCNAGAFIVGDHVLIQFTGQNWTQPTVIGFHDNPQECQKIWGYVFNDTNYNGVFDPGESGLDSRQVKLLDQVTQAVIETTTSDGTGEYKFSGVDDGSYTIQQIDATGWASTTPNNVNVTITGSNTEQIDFGDCLADSPYVLLRSGLYVTIYDPVLDDIAEASDPQTGNPIVFPVLESDSGFQRWYALTIALTKNSGALFQNRWDNDNDFFLSTTSACYFTETWGPFASASLNCPDTCYKQMSSFTDAGSDEWPDKPTPSGGGLLPVEYSETEVQALFNFFSDTGLVCFFEDQPGFEAVTAAYIAAWTAGELLPGHFCFGTYDEYYPGDPKPYKLFTNVSKCKALAAFEFYFAMGKLGNINAYDIDYGGHKSCLKVNHDMAQQHQSYGARIDLRFNFTTGAHPISLSRTVTDDYNIITPLGVESVTVMRNWSQAAPDTDPATTTTYSRAGDEQQQYEIAYAGDTIIQYYNHFVPVDNPSNVIRSCHASVTYNPPGGVATYDVFSETRNATLESAITDLITTAHAEWGEIETQFITGI